MDLENEQRLTVRLKGKSIHLVEELARKKYDGNKSMAVRQILNHYAEVML